jgi:hypothetical protein
MVVAAQAWAWAEGVWEVPQWQVVWVEDREWAVEWGEGVRAWVVVVHLQGLPASVQMSHVVHEERKAVRVALVALALAHNVRDNEGSTATIPTRASSHQIAGFVLQLTYQFKSWSVYAWRWWTFHTHLYAVVSFVIFAF